MTNTNPTTPADGGAVNGMVKVLFRMRSQIDALIRQFAAMKTKQANMALHIAGLEHRISQLEAAAKEQKPTPTPQPEPWPWPGGELLP